MRIKEVKIVQGFQLGATMYHSARLLWDSTQKQSLERNVGFQMTAGLPPGIHSDHVNGPRQGTSPFYFLICILRKQTRSLKYPSGLDSATVDIPNNGIKGG